VTNQESAELALDPVFRGRVKVSLLRYAENILGNPSGRTNALIAWARITFMQSDQVAQQYQGGVVLDGAVQSAGKDVTDQALQGAVESAVNKIV